MEEDQESTGVGSSEDTSTRGRTRSKSVYGESERPSPSSPRAPGASSSESPSPGRRRSSGRLSGKGGLSKKTLNIVNNLQAPQGSASSQRDKEEAEEERRLAQEEKKRQGLGAGLYGSKDADCDYMIRILLLGDSGVGKTSLMLRYSEDEFAPNLLSTAGVDFKVRHLTIDGKKVKCQVWDTSGQERFHVITRTYYKGANGIALVYDVTDPDSFRNVNYWMANIQTHADERVSKILLGNKTDLKERQISSDSGQNIAAEYGIGFFETSAKDGNNVKEGFYSLVVEILKRLELQQQGTEPNALGKDASRKTPKGSSLKTNPPCTVS